jgi:hypothetical protein
MIAGTEHSHWALWGTWRRGPDLVAHVADTAARCTNGDARIAIHVRDDVEYASNDDNLAEKISDSALSRFNVMVIESGDESLHIRISFVRQRGMILVGAREPRQANVKHGVVLEVTSDDPTRGDDVASAKLAVANAIERGRPRWVTRVPRHGRAARARPRVGFPRGQGGSASRLLESRLRRWPEPSGFPAIFTVLSLALYAGLITVLAAFDLYHGKSLDLGDQTTRIVVGVLGAVVCAAALLLQRWAFPAVEVSSLPNASRASRVLFSSLTFSTVIGLVLSFPGLEDLFK